MSVIPNAEQHMKDGYNVLVNAKHGVGKTISVRDVANKLGQRVLYFSCPTLDPYTDLTGVPVPKVDTNGDSYLELVRPKQALDADGIFFDELNRAHPKILNAVMEIIQFKTINGVPLPNLKWCWAAINPPGSEYEVEEVDVAIIDRFDFFYTIEPKVDAVYLRSCGVRPTVATAWEAWWKDAFKAPVKGNQARSDKDYISPRRVEKMARFYEQSKNLNLLGSMIPPGVSIDLAALKVRLQDAEMRLRAESAKVYTDRIGANSNFIDMNFASLRNSVEDLFDFVVSNPNDVYTQADVAKKIATGRIGVDNIFATFGSVINHMSGDVIESFYYELPSAKRLPFRDTSSTTTNITLYPNIFKAIKGLPSTPRVSGKIPTLDAIKNATKDSSTQITNTPDVAPVVDREAIRRRVLERSNQDSPATVIYSGV